MSRATVVKAVTLGNQNRLGVGKFLSCLCVLDRSRYFTLAPSKLIFKASLVTAK